MANVKAAAVLARVTFIKERFGEAGYKLVLQELEPAYREQLGQLLLPQEWLPVTLMVKLIDTTDRLLGNGDGALCREMARYAAEANLTTLYRLFFRISSASFVLGKAKALWNLHYDSGRLEVEELAPNQLALRLTDFDTPSCTHCRSVFAWAERSVEMSGGKRVAASVTGCRLRGAGACQCSLSFR
ncbi:MAG: hypothetical protein QM756_33860 [Polyangiaceae bacterium]